MACISSRKLALHSDRFFPADAQTREIARALYAGIQKIPIISPHGHTDPRWFATNAPFEDPTSLFLWPDHYLLRMLYSQGIALETLGLAAHGTSLPEIDRRKVWRVFTEHYHCFVAHRAACGWIMCSQKSSALRYRSTVMQPITITM